MNNEVYRTYEVLIEESVSADNPKRQHTSKESRHNAVTIRALQTTNDVFQDAVCYYLFLIIGLLRDVPETKRDQINLLWRTLNGSLKSKVEEVLKRLNTNYPAAPWHTNGQLDLATFLKKIYDWKKSDIDITAPALLRTYEILRDQASGETQAPPEDENEDDEVSSLENLKIFAGNWIAPLCNDGGVSPTIPGNGAYDRISRFLKNDPDDAKLDAIITAEFAKNSSDETILQIEEKRITEAKQKNAEKKKSDSDVEKKIKEEMERKVVKYIEAVLGGRTHSFSSAQEAKIKAIINGKQVPRFHPLQAGRTNAFFNPLLRYMVVRNDDELKAVAIKDIREFVARDKPEKEVCKTLPFLKNERTENTPLFPFFTNCLGVVSRNKSVWNTFDKAAFIKAAEEVFKYKIRSDKRRREYNARKGKILAMEGNGTWFETDEEGNPKRDQDGRQKTKKLGGIKDDVRVERIEDILGELGGGIGYGVSRATIGGWRDLREAFLKVDAKKGEELSRDDLEELVDEAQARSAGGFGSAALFKKLCEPENWCIWQKTWDNKRNFHPENFIFWYARYSEAREKLDALEEKDGSDTLKPISITLPGTTNRHGETSFRPFSFELSKIEPNPKIDLFDKKDGEFLLITTTGKDGEYPLTLSYRRLKRDRITTADGKSEVSVYQIPVVIDNTPNLFDSKKNKKSKGKGLSVNASLLPPGSEEKPFHLSMAFPVPVSQLIAATPVIGGKNSIKFDKKTNGYYPGAFLRWPLDKCTEPKTKPEKDTSLGKSKEKKVDWKPKEIWCSTDFAPFHILSVDLGVRFAGAWCRAEITRREPRDGERVISSPLGGEETKKIIFGVRHTGTFRLEGEDLKIWQKQKGEKIHAFLEEPWGSAGRKATSEEIKKFEELAERILPASDKNPVPGADELKFFPQLGEHLQFRLKRRIGQLRFLFNLRWRAIGVTQKIVRNRKSEYVEQEDALAALQKENRFRALDMLHFQPRNKRGVLFDDPKDIPENERAKEEPYMNALRKALLGLAAGDELEARWESLVPTSLFKKVRTKNAKTERDKKQTDYKNVLNSQNEFHWCSLADEAEQQITEIMRAIKGTDNGRDSLVAQVAHFIWPLKGKEWIWQMCSETLDGKQSFLEYSLNSEKKGHIAGMRGLNMRRIELFQEFRRCLQSLAKQERRFYRDANSGLEPSIIGCGDTVHEPAPAWLRRINEFREQRVKQTAHLILTEALGLRLKNPDEVEIDGKKKPELKSERDLHGRYERDPSKPIVSAIVLENLSRYRMSLDRSRFENRQLMEWSHRAVLLKLQDMAKVFGIQIFTVDARFSSRFSSRNGVPGLRCAEVSRGFENEYPWKKWRDETVKDAEDKKKRIPSKRAQIIMEAAAELNKLPPESKKMLILPMDGGPAFFPVVSHNEGEGLEANADINAAVNIGLRAVAHPDRLDIFPVFLAKPKRNGELELQKPKRGSFAKGEVLNLKSVEQKSEEIHVVDDETEDEDNDDEDAGETSSIGYLFALPNVDGKQPFTIPDTERYELPLSDKKISAATTKIFWSRVKAETLERMKKVNDIRLGKTTKGTTSLPKGA